jgi:hypothetical protein
VESAVVWCARRSSISAVAEGMIMWVVVRDLLIGLSILPIGLALAGSGCAGLWYILTKVQSRMHYLVVLISPIQTAAGIFLVYKSYDYMLRIFGIHVTNWL